MSTNETLARRWLASKHWGGWRVGMVEQRGCTCCAVDRSGACYFAMGWHDISVFEVECLVPDLDHPSTRAFLLEDVRKAWGCCVVTHPPCTLRPRLWSCEVERVDAGVVYWQRFQARTEAAALIAALEAAP